MNVSDPEIIEFAGCPTVVVRRETLPTDELVGFIDTAFTALGEAIRDGKFVPVGPGFTRWDTPMGDTLDLEVGFPVAEGWADYLKIGDVTLQPSTLPAGPVAVSELKGSLDDISAAWGKVRAALAERGRTTKRPFWEYYDVPPAPGREKRHQRTRLCAALER